MIMKYPYIYSLNIPPNSVLTDPACCDVDGATGDGNPTPMPSPPNPIPTPRLALLMMSAPTMLIMGS